MEPCLRMLLTSTVQVRSVVGYSETGDETLGPLRTVKAYVERKTYNRGQERTTQTVIVTEDLISLDDRLWLEGQDASNPTFSKRPEDVVVYKHPLTGSVDHYEVIL